MKFDDPVSTNEVNPYKVKPTKAVTPKMIRLTLMFVMTIVLIIFVIVLLIILALHALAG